MLVNATMDVEGESKQYVTEIELPDSMARRMIAEGRAVAVVSPRFVEMDGRPVWVVPIPPSLREQAIDGLRNRDPEAFLLHADNMLGLQLVWLNAGVLRELGIYECALLRAFQSVRVNTKRSGLPMREVAAMFRHADRARLFLAGQPFPTEGPFTLYRGVGGRGSARHVRGLSWTGTLHTAIWYADRARSWGLADPAVYTVQVNAEQVLAYLADRHEDEYILAPVPGRPERVTLTAAEWQGALERAREEHAARLAAFLSAAPNTPSSQEQSL